MQTLGFLPLNAKDGTRTAEDKFAQARRIVDAYAYASVVALWDGWDDNRPGLYFVLDGHPTSIASTFDRLASGLHFAARITDLR